MKTKEGQNEASEDESENLQKESKPKTTGTIKDQDTPIRISTRINKGAPPPRFPEYANIIMDNEEPRTIEEH